MEQDIQEIQEKAPITTSTGPGDPPDKLTPVTPLSAFAQQINKGLPPVLVVSDSFAKSQQVPVVNTLSSKDLTSYRPYLDNPDPNDPNLDLKRANAQSTGQQVLNTGGQLLTGLAGGFMQAIGTNLDVNQSINTLSGTEQEYGNMLTQAGDKLTKWGQDKMPIFETNPGEFKPSDPAWWMNKVAQAGPMIGMAGEALAETAAITLATEGTGLPEAIGDLADKSEGVIGAFKKIMGLGTNSERLKNSATIFGLLNRHNMSMMTASQTGQEEYESLIQKGYSEDQARAGAAKAASATYLSQMPLVALDILGFKAMTFNPVTQAAEGGLADSLVDSAFGHISNPLLKNAAVLGFEATKGAFEGSWMNLASDYGRYQADRLINPKADNSIGESFNDYVKGQQVADMAASGFIGGIVTGGLFKGYEHYTQGEAKNALKEQYKTFVDGMASTHVELSNAIQQADQEGNTQEANNLRRQLGTQKALSAIHLDQLQGQDAAFAGYKGFLQSTLDAVNSGNTDVLDKMNLTGHEDFLKQVLPQYIQDADHIKSIYDDTKEYNKPDAVVPITYHKFLIDTLGNELIKTKGDIAATEAGMLDLTNLSASAKAINDSTLQKRLFEARESNAKRELVGETDEVKKAGLQGIIDHAQDAQAYHQDIINKNKDITGNYADKDILDSLNKHNSKLNDLYEQHVDLETTLTSLRKSLAIWQDPKYQAKKTQARIADVINKSETTDDIEKAAKVLDTQNLLTPEVKQTLIDKKKSLEAKEEALSLKNKRTVVTPKENESPIQSFANTKISIPEANPFGQPLQPQNDLNGFGTPLVPDAKDIQGLNLSDERKNLSHEIFKGDIGKVENKSTKININDLQIGDSFTHNNNSYTLQTKGKGIYASTATHDLFGESHSLSEFPNEVEINRPNIEPTPTINATIVDDEPLFDPAPINPDKLTDEKKEGIKNQIADYTNSLKSDLGREPSFRDLADDFINHTSKDQVDKNWNLLKLGWEFNGKKANYDQIYNDIFGDRKAKGLSFFDYGNDIITEPKELNEQNEELSNKEISQQAEPGEKDLTEDGTQILKPVKGLLRTVSSTLKFAHLSLPYIRNVVTTEEGHLVAEYKNLGDQVNTGEYVDSRELMNPDKWSVGTKGYIQVAENHGDIPLTTWNEDWSNGKPIKFNEWAEGKDPNSEEYISRLPMTIHDASGKPVAMVHDLEWYNPINIGYADDEIQQKSIIEAAQKELLTLRKEVLNSNGKLDIEVSEKKPGTKMFIPKDKPLKTIAETDPDIKIGYVNNLGNIQHKDGIIQAENLLNKRDLSIGFKYELRQSGIDENGEPIYYANQLLYPKIDNDAKSSIIQALKIYAFQSDSRTDEVSIKSKEELKQVHKQVLEQTRLDLRSPQDLQKYINMFIATENTNVGTGTGEDLANRVATAINSNPKLLSGETPYISLQKGGIYFGIKGKLIDGRNEVNYFFPGMIGSASKDPVKGASLISKFLERMSQPDFLSKMAQNMDGDAVKRDTPVSHIIYDNNTGKTNVVPQEKYNDYLKKRLQTNLQSFDLGEDGKATFIQPVINFTYEKQRKALDNITGEVEIKPTSIPTPKVNEVKEESHQSDNQELINKITSEIEEYKQLGLSPEAIKALQSLKGGQPDFDPDYQTLTDEKVRNIRSKLVNIDNLDTTDRISIVKFIAAEAMNKIDPRGGTISKADLLRDVKDIFDNTIKPKIDSATSKIDDLTKLVETYPNLKPIVDELNNYKSNGDILNKNWSSLVNEASENYIEKFTGISIKMSKSQDNIDITPPKGSEETPTEINEHENDEEKKVDSNDQREKNYSKESVEDNFQNSVSYLVKRFLSQIPAYDKNGNIKTGFMGVPSYPGFDEYSKAIGSMLSSRGPVISDYEDIKTRLNSFAEAHPFVNEVIKRLDAADGQLQNAFMYNFTRDNLTMKFVMSSFNTKNKKYQLKVYDTNSNEILRVIQTQWKNNFNQSPLVNSDSEINQVKAQSLLDTYNNWINKRILPTPDQTKDFLNHFGITLSEDALKELMDKGYYVPEGNKNVLLSFKNKDGGPGKMFDRTGLFGHLAKKLSLMVAEKTNKDYTENDNLNPFEDARDIMKKLANIEAKYSSHLTTNSFRDGDKTIFGFTPGKFATALAFRLKSDPEFLKSKQQISFDKHSFILNLLAEDQDFNSKFGVDHIGINAFNILGKSNYRVNNLNTLADSDGELTRLGFFQDKQGEVKSETPNGLPLRIARMFSPTMSDKSGMFDFTTAVLDLKTKDFENLDTKTGDTSDKIKDFAFSQLVEPELARIVSHYNRASRNQTNPNFLTNEKGYNLAAQIFNMIPKMNNLDYIQENGTKGKLLDFLAHSNGQITPEVYQHIVDKIKPQAHQFLDEIIKENVGNKLDLWEKNGYVKRDSEGNISSIAFLDNEYLNARPGTNDEKLKVAANDYVINSMIHEANMHMLLAGDVANYSQDKVFKNRFELDENGNPQTWKPIGDNIYQDLSQDVGINLGKRLAMLNAPGNTIAHSKGDKYVQLFAKDRVSVTENLGFLIGLYHGKEAEKQAQSYINILKTSDNPTEVKNITNKLAKQYPDLAAYLSIESTDAQEYTTAKEHIDIIYRQGRMSDMDYQRINKILMAQRAAEKKSGTIPEDLFLTPGDMKLLTDPIIGQPQKPVVTGQMPDPDSDLSRMIYIKSSAFPLFPQVTQGTELNELRKGMEDVQERLGKNVRMSYDTANKVGAPLSSKQLQIWDNQGKYIPGAINADKIYSDMENNIPTHALIMDRENFRIQQDVPYRPEHQTETFGTQMMKEMFGDGVGQITDKIFDYNGQKVSGKELMNHVNNHIDSWLRNEKSKLYNQLGLDENTGQPIDKLKSIQKLQSLLQQEAKKRGYPQQDIDALEVKPIYDNDGKTIKDAQFTIPLWLSPNSNRYESLLNAVITSRLIDLKLPGGAYVAGSEEGFRNQEIPEGGTNPHESRTIYTKDWNGSLQPASKDEKGNFTKPQVLVSSKLRDNEGHLLDLFKKDENGKEIYIYKDKQGRWRLNEDMIDDELKSGTSFRIPTSYHQSMSNDNIVGYLPPEAGNLKIVPKNYTKQKGLDFDIDQEHTYQLWHNINESNKVVPIEKGDTNLSNYDETHQGLKEAIEHFRNIVKDNAELQGLIDQYKDEIAVSDEYGYDPKDAKKFISQLKGGINYDVKKSDLRDLVNAEKGLVDLKSKLHQNEIIKAYNSVLGNGDDRIQQKINKVLSTDFAEEQANLIDNLISEGKDNSNFTILSDQYQKDKMTAGAVGKMAIGVYANYSVFHSLVQQSERSIGLMTKDDEGNTIPYSIQIGNIKSDGSLGHMTMLSEKGEGRNIANVIGGEKLSTATDAEKLRTLDRTGINGTTINIDATLSLLGFDKANATINDKPVEISIPYFLLSQPIIKDYVDMMANIKSNIAEYNAKADEEVINKLNEKYSNNGTLDYLDKEQIAKERERLTGQKLVDNIIDKGNDGVSQQAILHLFKELQSYGETLIGLQSKLNIQRNGLGKSMFEMLEKYNNVSSLAYNGKISNIDSLIGHYITGDDFDKANLQEFKEQGYAIFNLGGMGNDLPFAVKPTTATGSLIVHSAKSGYELWSKYFPHSNPLIKKTIDDIIGITSTENIKEAKKLEMQYEVFSEMKKYLYSSDRLGLFKGNPQDERERLFMDKDGKESLASYLNKFSKSGHENSDLILSNKLLNKFQYQLEKGKLPSIIKYDNSKGEDFNEEYKYHALIELMDKNAKIDDFQGKPYTTRMLAKDLINYSFLEGGIQEAIQFVKYIPVAYLKEMGFSDNTELWQRAANGELFMNGKGETINLWQQMLGTSSEDLQTTEYPRFVQQYFQHNPGRLQKLTTDNIDKVGYEYTEGKRNLENLVKFLPKGVDDPKPYIAIYNRDSKAKNKNQIYKFDGKAYNRIPNLGVFGMSEYSIKDNNVKPLIDNAREPVSASINTIPQQNNDIQTSFFDLDKGHLGNSIKSISEAKLPGFSEIADLLTPYLSANTKLKVGDVSSDRARGQYFNNEITISQRFLDNPNTTKELIASTLLHEVTHSLTSDYLSKYFDKRTGALLVDQDKLPADVNRINRLYREVEKNLGPELQEFRDWYSQNADKGIIRNQSDRLLYAGMNVHEFTAMIMSEPDIQSRMAEMQYKESGKTLLQQFFESIRKVLTSLGIKFNEDSVTSHGIDSILSLLDNQKKESEQTQDFISSFGKVINPTGDDHIEKLLDKLKLQDDLDNERPETNIDLSPEEKEKIEQDCIF